MTDISEEVVVAEAKVLAGRMVGWFRERLRIAEAERDAADERRVGAEDERRTANAERKSAERRVVEVEELLAASEELSEQLQRALESRVVIEQAKGLLAERHGVTPDAAFEAMRHYARSNRRRLHDVAAEVMAGTADLQM